MERASHHHCSAQPPAVAQTESRVSGMVTEKEVSSAVMPVAVEA